MSKYGNVKTVIDGITFDSKREAKRYQELLLLEKAGQIIDLKRQVKFELTPKQKNPVTGKSVRESSYIADFVYFDTHHQRIVVEDSKGFSTDLFKFKQKLMLKQFGIWVQTV